MDTYCMYLRKSRADLDAEARGEGETLKKHRTALFALAKKLNIHISKVYPEIVSGERVAERPEMLKLLEDVEEGKWTGVFVMEVERLARGDTMDQGLVAQTFKYSGTKIFTPMKVYDPDNEYDEEYFEFGLFMSRREYKTINRRQQNGRLSSVGEGNYIGNIPPYGYRRIQLADKSHTLEPHPEQAPIVNMIYDMYTTQNMGMGNIAKKLNLLSVPTAKGGHWTVATISGIIQNPVYNGEIVWKRRPLKKTRKAGQIIKTRNEAPESEWIRAKGKHKALVSTEIWNKAQHLLKSRYHPPSPTGVITSSLAGLVRCADCGRFMVRRPYTRDQEPTLICVTPLCKNISSRFSMVEDRILEGLKIWITQYKTQWEQNVPVETDFAEDLMVAKQLIVADVEKQINKLRVQKGSLHDLLESGAYTIDVFMERSQNLTQRITEAENALARAKEELDLENRRSQAKSEIIPKVEHVLEVYHKTTDASERNELLKSVMEPAVYSKKEKGHWSKPETMAKFDLQLFPKLPEH
ncbi:recombinase family protein [Paenibacillus sp. sgz500958]|uniref:recombinase family protein n=1 Tax=Paenibacillus sp. sgz500958 TaxID=3242475 RepID=UPI0036D3CD2E